MFKEINSLREEGFTLTEVIIVLVIIGVLAAIAIPVFANNRNKGIDDKMKNSMQNLASNIETKRLDNVGKYPTESNEIENLGSKIDPSIKWQYIVNADGDNYCLKASLIKNEDNIQYMTKNDLPSKTSCTVS